MFFFILQTIEMIEKEQREAERRPITKITHKGEIEIESQEPVKAPEPAEVRDTANITMHYCLLTLGASTSYFVPLVSLSLLPRRQKSQQNLQNPLRKKQRVPTRTKTQPTNTSLTYLTYTAKSAQVNPDMRKKAIKLCLYFHVNLLITLSSVTNVCVNVFFFFSQ